MEERLAPSKVAHAGMHTCSQGLLCSVGPVVAATLRQSWC